MLRACTMYIIHDMSIFLMQTTFMKVSFISSHCHFMHIDLSLANGNYVLLPESGAVGEDVLNVVVATQDSTPVLEDSLTNPAA